MRAIDPKETGLRGLSAVAALIFWAFSPSAASCQISVVPQPAAVNPGDGFLTVRQGASVDVDARDKAAVFAVRWLVAEVYRARRLKLRMATGSRTIPVIRFMRQTVDPSLGAEGYRLDVTQSGATVQASSDAGLFYGAATLLQLLTPDDGAKGVVQAPVLQIDDRPRYGWRGLMLDSARHLQSVAFIKKLLDQMARYKLNVFQWHLCDDQGWRLQIKGYPRLTALGAYRVEAGPAARRDIDPATGKPRLYGGFYTQKQVREVVAFAKARGITVVPEIEMPGHASAAIFAYPNLGTRPVDPETLGDWGVFPNLYNADDATFATLKAILDQVMDLFPSPFIHLGGDEAIKSNWRASPAIKAKIAALGLANESALQGWFVQKVNRYLSARGRRLVGWDEIIDDGLPPRAVVMSWHGRAKAAAAEKAGHDVVLSPGTPMYFDNRQSTSANEPPGRGLLIPLKSVYDYDPEAGRDEAPGDGVLLGLQGNVWTEHIRFDERVEHMAFPRAAALAEAAWTPQEGRSWKSFIARLPSAIRRDRAEGLQPALSAFEVRSRLRAAPVYGTQILSLSTEAGLGVIRFTLDGSPPTPRSTVYTAPFTVSLPFRLRAQNFEVDGAPLGLETDQLVDLASLQAVENHALRPCTELLLLNLEEDGPTRSRTRKTALIDVMNPCWIWRRANLSATDGLSAVMARLPFNFQLGGLARPATAASTRLAPETLEVRIDSCSGPLIAALPLTGPVDASGVLSVTGRLRPLASFGGEGVHDLCIETPHTGLDHIWAVNRLRLESGPRP